MINVKFLSKSTAKIFLWGTSLLKTHPSTPLTARRCRGYFFGSDRSSSWQQFLCTSYICHCVTKTSSSCVWQLLHVCCLCFCTALITVEFCSCNSIDCHCMAKNTPKGTWITVTFVSMVPLVNQLTVQLSTPNILSATLWQVSARYIYSVGVIHLHIK